MKHAPHIARIALETPLRKLFDYLIPSNIDAALLQPGVRVKISFGTRETVGIVIQLTSETKCPTSKLKPILEIIDSTQIITPSIFELCEWASAYYHHSLGDILFNALPPALRTGKPLPKKITLASETPSATTTNITLNPEQASAVQSILKDTSKFHCFLLHGVTGSGKTEVYFQAIDQLLKQEKQILVLVPEISLTPQTIQRFQDRFQLPIACFHSKMTPKNRLHAWIAAKEGLAPIIIGTRSAVFVPTKTLGMIIIDEEHDPSFKQQEGFRYSARDLAVMRAHIEKTPIVLGSATPSLESFYNAQTHRYTRLTLPERAGNAIHPHYHFIDTHDLALKHGLSKRLLAVIQKHLDANNQVLLFLNRRGYAPTLRCPQCGWIATCKQCDAHLTIHQAPPHLHCHHCDATHPIFTTCPKCGHTQLQSLGTGTERLEKTLSKHFANIPIVRIDRDTTRKKDALENLLQTIQNGQKQILVGTQMVAKGHHFPNVTLVGIINADAGFFSADFRATEHTGQLLLQVSGRAGRAEKPGEVFIQTDNPHHPLLQRLTQDGYTRFAEFLLTERLETRLPPYSFFALIRSEAINQEWPETFLNEVKKQGEPFSQGITVWGPIPALMQKRKRYYRAQLLFQATQRSTLQTFLDKLIPVIEQLKLKNKVRWSLDVDPMDVF
ncbi:MAG: primosomal protein N' [Gammaproteobacteria bacterium]|nr:primosomal protein N' [Gammaproteobacteria bacterium]